MIILVPISVKSRFFSDEDYPFPKPLIEVSGKPMIERVIDNLSTIAEDLHFVFIVAQDDVARYSMDSTLRLLTKGKCDIVALHSQTQGSLCSCLMAIDFIDQDHELLIVNGDQILNVDINAALLQIRTAKAGAGVVTFDSVHPRWSYVKLDENGNAVQAEEKKVISRNAVAGFYYFRRGAEFVQSAMATIEADRSVDGIFYVAPCLNEIILKGGIVATHQIERENYLSFYSPAKISEFEDQLLSGSIGREWAQADRLNIVIPAAGEGSRFAEAGYENPKPFIDVLGHAMIEHVLDNVKVENAHFSLLLRSDHIDRETRLTRQFMAQGHTIVPVKELTEGTACTVLLARKHFDSETPLLIANSDQLVNFDCQAFVRDCIDRNLDGSILIFRDASRNPKWSYARVDEDGIVREVAEKTPISDLATAGIYLFRRGSSFTSAAIDMIAANERVNGEFYTCPVYNHLIRNGARIGVYEVPASAMHGLGTPKDLDAYLKRMRTG
jgi:dTDP-glucose pyrophosphorylase